MKKTLCLSFLAFLLVPLPAGAASKDNLMQDVFVLDTITVTDEKKAGRVARILCRGS